MARGVIPVVNVISTVSRQIFVRRPQFTYLVLLIE